MVKIVKILFYERFIELCKANNIKPTPTMLEMGFSRGLLRKWKTASNITIKSLETVANYFGVSLDYFSSENNISRLSNITETQLTEAEHNAIVEDITKIYPSVIKQLVALADKHNIDRDDLIRYFADVFSTMVRISTFVNWGNSDG